ncbi:galactose mutarotase-like protein [Corynespora cassiicola Philippines]|uniref:Galactose mutarotase-like protein n=1 Tax=Corynespora cassiicola Philippines TaxID=1448308 RepID=A0A2T2P2L9_CORCC|nr:galactose mutarotase-like protein [Corynespora cassiicola Philippines]
MRLAAGLAALAAVVSAKVPQPDADGRYTLQAEGIKAQFIPYAGTLTNLWVADKNGIQRDIVLGYDNTSFYPVDPGHPVYNAIPGRYANRIGNGTFQIDNITYHTPLNDGPNTLHSGPNNWSFRFWNVSSYTNSSITFTLHDPANSTGMPGSVDAVLTYSLTPHTWHITIDALSPDAKTPIQLTQHTYFQLDAFARPDNNRTVWNHTLHMPAARRVLEIDANALPTGVIADVEPGSVADFWSEPHQLGFASGNAEFQNNCGNGCHGYNGNWAFDGARDKGEVALTLSSAWSGIKGELRTNQDAVVLYSCNWNDGKTEYKRTQGWKGEGDKFIPRDGCLAVEAQDYVDGINNPEWGRIPHQIFGPGDKYHWESSWTFGLIDEE